MRRIFIVVLAALPLSLGVAASASAHGRGDGGRDHRGSSKVTVSGTIVSVDASANTFVANAFEVGHSGYGDPSGDSGGWGGGSGGWGGGSGGWGGGSGGWGGGPGGYDARRANHRGGGSDSSSPTTTQVTITTIGSSQIEVNGRNATISSLVAGQTFVATFDGSPGTDITTLVTNNPAVSIEAKTPPQAYAFVGTVTALDTTADTVTVNVNSSLPSGLVPSGSNPATFTVDSSTVILGGTSTSLFGALSNVSVGDVVAGGLVASAGEPLSQVESTPLKLLIDFPAGSGTGHAIRTSAINKAAKLLGIKTKTKAKKANRRGKAKAKKSKSHKHQS
jgi:hypothetical protein